MAQGQHRPTRPGCPRLGRPVHPTPVRHLLPGPLGAHRWPQPAGGLHDIPPDRTGAGDNLYVKCKRGDLVVWSMRITHSGNGMLLKDPKARFPLPNEQRYYSADEERPATATGSRSSPISGPTTPTPSATRSTSRRGSTWSRPGASARTNRRSLNKPRLRACQSVTCRRRSCTTPRLDRTRNGSHSPIPSRARQPQSGPRPVSSRRQAGVSW